MRRRRWVFLLLCLSIVSLFCFQLSTATATLRVKEAATRFLFEKERTGAQLAIENFLGWQVQAHLIVELIDPQGTVRASNERDVLIREGASSLFVSLLFQPSNLNETERKQLLWYRLRYRITPKDSAVDAAKTEGVISLSEIAPDLFDVRVAGSAYAREGGRYRARVRALNPVSERAVAGVSLEAQVRIENDNDEKHPTILKMDAITDEEGYATLDFNLPRSIKSNDGEIKITARRGTLLQELSEDIQFDALSRIYISTDKPLYQPGQIIHARGLIFSPSMQALANVPMPFKIEDPEGTIVYRADLETSRFGIASADWTIPENTRLGEYTIAFGREDDSYAIYRIKISRYDLPNFTASVKPDRPYYLPGQNAEVTVSADYLFGQPVKRGHVRVIRETTREWNYREQKWDTEEGDKYEGETDAEGRFTAHINLAKEHEDLKDNDWRRFKDVTYAAYFTDTSTARTEQRRFDLRVTKEAIHVYVIGETYSQSSRLPLAFYLSTFYADGTPAQCDVLISQGLSDDKSDGRAKGGGRRVAEIRTNSYGLAKIEIPKPPFDEDAEKVYLRFDARDAQGKVGRRNEDFYYRDNPAIRVETDHALYRAGEPVSVNVQSSEQNLNVTVDVVKDAQVIRSEMVRLRDGRATLSIPYDAEFKDELTIVAYADLGADDVVHDSHSILYPFDHDLKLDVNPAQSVYRPGEEAHVRFDVRSADGRAIESALGVTVFDRAVEERARTDQEFGSSSNFYGNYAGLLGWDDQLAGVTRKDLERLDLSKPVSADLSLLAEVLLNKTGGYYPNFFGGKEYELDAVKIFAPSINEQFKAVQDALNARYKNRMEYPADEASLQRILNEAGINFAALSDPWAQPYRAVFSVEDEKDVLRIYSAGADKRFNTPDDFSVVVLSWSYFRPIGEAIDRTIQKYHTRTGGYIRDAATLRSELMSEGIGSDKLLDRWGKPYQLEFGVDGVHYVLRVRSGGPNRKFEAASASKTDDFIVWTSMIDYFAERRAQIDAALNSQWKEKHSFPQDMKSLRTVLRRAQIDFDSLRDPWGHEFYATFKTESRFTDRAEIEVRAKYGEKGQTHTEIKPVTQKIGKLLIRSAGADGKQGTADDFDAATFTIVLSEQTACDAKQQGGAITGTITDMMGAVVPNANVKATLSSTEQFYETTTDAEGKFILRNLPSGTYEVLVTSSGFKNMVMTNVLVSKSNIVQLNVSLEAGAVSEMVEVTSTAEQVQTSSSQLSTQQITELPISGRNSYGLIKLQGGIVNIVPKSGTSAESSTPRLREYFPETLVWQPSLETDAQGRAELRFKLADNITTWKLSVIGSTKTGEIGIAEKEIRAFQPFFVEHDPPRVLTVGDEIELPVVVRNYLDKPQSVQLEIKPESWFQLLGAAEKSAEVPAGDNSRQTFAFRATSFVKDGKQLVVSVFHF